MTSKTLIVSPHMDDEVLSCFSVLNNETHVAECGVDKFHIVSREERIKEMQEVAKFCGFTFSILPNTVNRYVVPDLIEELTEIINTTQPNRIFIPYPSYNQDHRAVYYASITALRNHDINFFVKKVLVYDGPDVPLWDYAHNIHGSFKANYFLPIDIDLKITAYGLLKSQVRSFRGPDVIKAIAYLRGRQANMQYAEGFKVLRWID